MIPEERLSTTAITGSWLNPPAIRPIKSFHWGPVALQDPSRGMFYQMWTAEIDFDTIFVHAPNTARTDILTHGKEVKQVSLAFDQNGLEYLAFVDVDGDAFLRWYDTAIPGYTITALVGYVTPRLTLDDARDFQNGNNDVIMVYVRASNMYYRQQRDRFTVEKLLAEDVNAVHHVSMNNQLRLQFAYDGVGESRPPYLADVVSSLLGKSNIEREYVDDSQLWVPIKGLRVANEGNAAAAIATLTPAYFFDAGSWDKKMRFVMRGGEPVAHLTFDDLLERTGSEGPLGIERVQEVELLRKVNVTMVDETAGWIPNKQTAERRSATIQAIGETSLVIPITADPDFIATVAVKRLRIPWGEPNKFKYGLGIPWSALTPTDVITLEDRKGRVYRMRIALNEEDYGTLTFESNSDAQWIYKLTAIGVSAPPSIPTVPGQVGDTVVLIVNVPVMRDQDDELGYRIAAYGTGNGWNGGVLQMSLDGGASINQSLPVLGAASVGETVTALLPEVSSEYLSDQTLRITSQDQPESVTREDVLRYANLAAVQRADGSWEVLQHEVSTPVDPTTFDLSGLVRGRYATEPLAVPAGAPYVKLDSSVLFVQIQRWMLGMTIHYRGISAGQNADDVAWQSFVVEDVASQTEWPVSRVTAVRDVSDNVTVEWIGRGRLGVEIAPRNSKYFDGYRVTYSDGYTADTTATTHTRASTPPSVTVTVAGINEITGLGPSSEGILI